MSPSPDALVAIVQEALLLAVAIVVPWLGAMWVLSIVLGAAQSALQLHDPLVLHAPRVLVGIALLLALGGWMARPVMALATRVFSLGLRRWTSDVKVIPASDVDASALAVLSAGGVLHVGGRVLARGNGDVVVGDALGSITASLDTHAAAEPGDIVVLAITRTPRLGSSYGGHDGHDGHDGHGGRSVPLSGAASGGLPEQATAGGLLAEIAERRIPVTRDGAGRDVSRFLYGGVGRQLQARDLVLRAIRGALIDERFVELQPPIVVPSPGLDVHLDAVAVGESFLITSPEYQMKRALVGGLPRCFAITPCFRRDEAGTWHNPEFTMLEWYRAFAGHDEIMADTEALVAAAVNAVRPHAPALRVGRREISIQRPFARISVADAFSRFAGLLPDETLRLASEDEDVFFHHMVDDIEPALAAMSQPVFLVDYPASQASLARRKPSDPRWAERFELYAAGVELCNGFGELTDPVEQRSRLTQDQEERRRRGLAVYPIDSRFLEALEAGLPPCAGNALGLDRLVALAMGAQKIADVQAFPLTEL